jgi:hypothetical protein
MSGHPAQDEQTIPAASAAVTMRRGFVQSYKRTVKRALAIPFLLAACGQGNAPTRTAPPAASAASYARADEPHLDGLRRLTFGGENAEAYWSWNGQELIFQARPSAATTVCDRIYRMKPSDDPPQPIAVSSGKGATTCSFFLPGDQEVIYASTHLGGDRCPPRPDHSKGYVWALYDTYDIFRANVDGTNVRRLTETKGYDAEGTVCKKDGSIVFTSTRDGDIDLYRMDADGANVRRLTDTPGYDGGAFFNADCTRIVWRASRPKPGPELEEYKAFLGHGLVKPTKLEIYVGNADGSDPVQLTYLNAASFAPYWHPSEKRILFSSNYGDPKGREFDLWAVNTDGTGLERITRSPGFDGFPMFSPDGAWLAFSSNRSTAPGAHDTDVFVARWVDDVGTRPDAAADRIMADIAWLADPARQGRGIGTAGLDAAGEYLEKRFAALHLLPGADGGTFRQTFSVTTGVSVGTGTSLTLGGKAVAMDAFAPLGFSAVGTARSALAFAGYGIVAKELGVDDYARVDAKGRIVLVRRFVPEQDKFSSSEAQRRYGDLRYKAWVAREHGATALSVVDLPSAPPGVKDWKMADEATMPGLVGDGEDDAGIPVVIAKRAVMADAVASLARGASVQAALAVSLAKTTKPAFNVVARLPAGAPEGERLPGVVVIGAHYDHLGFGGPNSLAPERHEPHVGADDNASGTGAMLEVARALASSPKVLRRDVLFLAFSGEEEGVLGSTEFTRHPSGGLTSMADAVAMLNLDMVGRMRDNKLSVMGGDTAAEWSDMVARACDAARVDCTIGGDGYGPSDQTPFYAAGVPVLFFFTGAHSDYHKPSDVPTRINAAGTAAVARIASDLVTEVAGRTTRLTYRSVPSPAPRGDRRSFNASLGTIPDYAGPPKGMKGVLLAGVRSGGAADKGGLRRGDILVRLGTHVIGSVEDFMFALNASKPGETVTAVVVRDGKETPLDVTFQEGHR